MKGFAIVVVVGVWWGSSGLSEGSWPGLSSSGLSEGSWAGSGWGKGLSEGNGWGN